MICPILILQWVYIETKAFKVKQKWLHKNTAMLKQGYEWYLGIIEGHCLVYRVNLALWLFRFMYTHVDLAALKN